MNNKIDIELIKLCISNDRIAQQKLYKALLPYLNTVCQRYLYELVHLEDVLQEVFINVFNNLSQYDDQKANFRIMLVTICQKSV